MWAYVLANSVWTPRRRPSTIAALKVGCVTFGKAMLKADPARFKITGFGAEKDGP